MATLYINFNPSPHAGNADAAEALTTSTSKATSTAQSIAVSGEVELFSTAAHLVHVAAAPDADGPQAFYVFPNEPKRVNAGKGVKVSAKTLA